MHAVTIAPEPLQQPDVARLLLAADDRSAALYGVDRRPGSSLASLLARQATMLVARIDARAVGCGGYIALEPGIGELTRIFVEPAARGAGLGRRLVVAIEGAAHAAGIRTMRLETGVQSAEAIGLYRALGYVPRGRFGRHVDDPLSLFMERPLG